LFFLGKKTVVEGQAGKPDVQCPAAPPIKCHRAMSDSGMPDFGSLKLAIVWKIATDKVVEGMHDTLEICQRRTTIK
jgi:hypothetical protein